MVRSPFLILIFLQLFFSCKNDFKDKPHSNQNNSNANSFRAKAEAYFAEDKFDSAFFYYNKSKGLYELTNDSANIAYCLYQMSRAQQTYGDYNGSEETLTELLDYKLRDYEAPAYNLLGVVSKELSSYDDAINRYTVALNNTKQSIDKLSPLNNMAAVYIQKEEYQKAISILEPILKTHLLDTDALQNKKARILDNLGFAYFKSQRNKEGLDFMNRSLAMRNEINDTYGIIESYLHLTEYYQNKNIQESNNYALEAYKNATKHKSIDERLEALSFLMKNNYLVGKNQYTNQFLILNDSITKVRNNAKNQFAKIKYDSKKEKDENQQLKIEKAENLLQLEREKYQKILFIFGISMLIMSIIFLIRYYRTKNKIEKQQATYETETRIAKRLHDELANDVFQTMSFAKTQDLQKSDKKEVLLDNLDKIYLRTRNISRENSEIDTGVGFEKVIKQMLTEYGNDSVRVIIKDNYDINWDKIQPEVKVAIYRVLQELMVNMRKHSQASLVVIGFEDKDKTIQIMYSDNGIGVSRELNLNNGLKNVENRIQAVKGTITFETETDKGFKVRFSLPK